MAAQMGGDFTKEHCPGTWKVWRAHFLLGGGNSKKGGHVSQVTGPFDLTGHRLSDSSEHK